MESAEKSVQAKVTQVVNVKPKVDIRANVNPFEQLSRDQEFPEISTKANETHKMPKMPKVKSKIEKKKNIKRKQKEDMDKIIKEFKDVDKLERDDPKEKAKTRWEHVRGQDTNLYDQRNNVLGKDTGGFIEYFIESTNGINDAKISTGKKEN